VAVVLAVVVAALQIPMMGICIPQREAGRRAVLGAVSAAALGSLSYYLRNRRYYPINEIYPIGRPLR